MHGSKKWATFSEEKVAVAVAAVRIYSQLEALGWCPSEEACAVMD